VSVSVSIKIITDVRKFYLKNLHSSINGNGYVQITIVALQSILFHLLVLPDHGTVTSGGKTYQLLKSILHQITHVRFTVCG